MCLGQEPNKDLGIYILITIFCVLSLTINDKVFVQTLVEYTDYDSEMCLTNVPFKCSLSIKYSSGYR